VHDPKVALNKARLWILGDDAKNIYDSIGVSELNLPADKVYSSNIEKSGSEADCYKQVPVTNPTAIWYSCYLYLDVSVGSIDKTSVGRL